MKNTPGWSTTWISGLSVDGVFHPAASTNIQTFNTNATEQYSVLRVKAADYFMYAIEGQGKTWSARCPYEFAYVRLNPGQVYYMGTWNFTFDQTIGKPNWKWENEMSDAKQYVGVKFGQAVNLTLPPSRKSHLMAAEEAKCPAGTTMNKVGTGV